MLRLVLFLSAWAFAATVATIYLIFANHQGAQQPVAEGGMTMTHANFHVPQANPHDGAVKPRRDNSPVPVETDAAKVIRATGQACRPSNRYAYIKTHKTGSSTMTNMFHRYAVHHNLSLALPRDNLFYGWPHARNDQAIPQAVEHVGGSKAPYDVLCSGHLIYDHKGIEAVVPGAQYVTSLREPIGHFVSSWNHWHVGDHIVEGGGPAGLTVEMFATDPGTA